jgi:hypothetical protein
VLGDLLGDAWHFYQIPPKYVLVASEEDDELTFLFGVKAGTNLDGPSRVLGVDSYNLGILGHLGGTRQGGHGRPIKVGGTQRYHSLSSAVATAMAASSMLFCSKSNAR